MASQVAVRLLERRPIPGRAGRLVVTIELACGCVVDREVAADRVLDDVDPPRAVGKYACPVEHPVVAGETR